MTTILIDHPDGAGPDWIREQQPAPATATFHLEGQHDQRTHGRRIGKAAAPLSEPDSGFTVSTVDLKPVTSGFAVALSGTDKLIVAPDAFYPDGSATPKMKRMVSDRIDAARITGLPAGTKRALGAWHNPADGKIEVNVTAVFPADQRDAAFAYAQDQDQIAMADLTAITAGDWGNAIIDTGGTGGDRQLEDPLAAAAGLTVFRLDP